MRRTFFNAAGAAVRRAVLIDAIIPGSQAEQAGLRVGDIITAYDGSSFDRVDLPDLISRPGKDKRGIRAIRDGHAIEFVVNPGPLGIRFEWRSVPDETRADAAH